MPARASSRLLIKARKQARVAVACRCQADPARRSSRHSVYPAHNMTINAAGRNNRHAVTGPSPTAAGPHVAQVGGVRGRRERYMRVVHSGVRETPSTAIAATHGWSGWQRPLRPAALVPLHDRKWGGVCGHLSVTLAENATNQDGSNRGEGEPYRNTQPDPDSHTHKCPSTGKEPYVSRT